MGEGNPPALKAHLGQILVLPTFYPMEVFLGTYYSCEQGGCLFLSWCSEENYPSHTLLDP